MKIINYLSLSLVLIIATSVIYSFFELTCGAFIQHPANVTSVDVNCQNIIASASENEVYLWDEQNCIYRLNAQDGHINSVAFSHNGQLLASCSLTDGIIKVWSLKDKRVINEFSNYKVHKVAFDMTDKYIISESDDGSIQIWDWKKNRSIKTIEMAVRPDWRNSISISRNNNLGYIDSNCNLKVFDLNTFRQTINLKDYCGKAQISPNGKLIAVKTKGNSISIINITSGHIAATINNDQDAYAFEPFKFSLNSKWLVNGVNGNLVEVWDWQKNKLIETLGISTLSSINEFVFSKNNELITAGNDRSVKIWDLTSGRLKIELGDGVYLRNLFSMFFLVIVVSLFVGYLGIISGSDNTYSSFLIISILSIWTLGISLLLVQIRSGTRYAALITWASTIISAFFVFSIYHTLVSLFILPVGLFFGYMQIMYERTKKSTYLPIFISLILSAYVCYWAFFRH